MKKTKEGGKKGISFLIVRSLFWKSPRNSLSLRFVRTLASLSIPPPRGGSTHTRAVRNSARHWAITTRFTRLCLRAWFDIRGESVCIHRFCGNVYKQCFVLNEFNVVVVLEDRGNEFYFSPHEILRIFHLFFAIFFFFFFSIQHPFEKFIPPNLSSTFSQFEESWI